MPEITTEKRNEYRKRYYQKSQKNHPQPVRWTDEEDELVIEHAVTDAELSDIIDRSVQAIQIRRTRLLYGRTN